jgi:Transposase family tnp2
MSFEYGSGDNSCMFKWLNIISKWVQSDLDKCPKCNASQYKLRDNEIEVQKRPVAKVLWYLPIIPRFQRLFANSKVTQLLRWHVDDRKYDGMLRYPGDSPEWRNINRIFKDFGDDPRNLWLGLCTDGIVRPFFARSAPLRVMGCRRRTRRTLPSVHLFSAGWIHRLDPLGCTFRGVLLIGDPFRFRWA